MPSRYSLFFILLLHFQTAIAAASHGSGGTHYSREGVLAYEQARHGEDGKLFLDPYFIPFIQRLYGCRVLDAGCGAGPWAIVAARHGAEVFGIDIQEEMIERANATVRLEGLADRVHMQVGTVAELPYDDLFFDNALSINVGCNLPGSAFDAHFKEMHRTLKAGGRAVMTTPASYGVVFTDGSDAQLVQREILSALERIGTSRDAAKICAELKPLDFVLRATFAYREGKLVLIRNEADLEEGEEIWRKIPGLAVPNYYHSEGDYVIAAINAGFVVDKVECPKCEQAALVGTNLGGEYAQSHPFAIFQLRKR